MSRTIDTDKVSEKFRALIIKVPERKILIANLRGTEQEKDLGTPLFGEGFGRVRHFKRRTDRYWPSNPLPIDPAARALGLSSDLQSIDAFVFQSAACNWRCWYCYVPFNLLSANPKRGRWLSAGELLTIYGSQRHGPAVIDLSGGQPELTPEWIYWVIGELQNRGLDTDTYLWSDDNLSTDYFWRYLNIQQQEAIVSYKNYGRVGCFKGFDELSFVYNTAASSDLFDRQFDLMKRYVASGMDIYAYVTLTSPAAHDLKGKMSKFFDRLQTIDVNLPLRTIPLKVQIFSPVQSRMNDTHAAALSNQDIAIKHWKEEISSRFSVSELQGPIVNIRYSHLTNNFNA